MTEHCESSDGDFIGETVLEGIALRRAGQITAVAAMRSPYREGTG